MRRPLNAGSAHGPAWNRLLLTGACETAAPPRLRDQEGTPLGEFLSQLESPHSELPLWAVPTGHGHLCYGPLF